MSFKELIIGEDGVVTVVTITDPLAIQNLQDTRQDNRPVNMASVLSGSFDTLPIDLRAQFAPLRAAVKTELELGQNDCQKSVSFPLRNPRYTPQKALHLTRYWQNCRSFFQLNFRL